jgi:hypothetical protein
MYFIDGRLGVRVLLELWKIRKDPHHFPLNGGGYDTQYTGERGRQLSRRSYHGQSLFVENLLCGPLNPTRLRMSTMFGLRLRQHRQTKVHLKKLVVAKVFF